MTSPTLDEIADLVHNYFADQDKPVSYDPEEGTGEYDGAVFSVHNMAANLARIDRDQWPDYVDWHFSHLVDGGPPELPTAYPEARKRLRVRLASTDWVKALPYRAIVRPVADDLHEVLMMVIEGGATSIPPDSLDSWSEPIETLWADARTNTLWDEPCERRLALKPTGERFTWVRGSWWTASRLLDLGRYLSPKNPHGAIAMVPVRDALIFHEITDAAVVPSLASMAQIGLQWFADGPDSVSPHVFSWQDGVVCRIVACENGRLNPVWGDEFGTVLANLDAGADQPALN